jgi:hypothetical protein
MNDIQQNATSFECETCAVVPATRQEALDHVYHTVHRIRAMYYLSPNEGMPMNIIRW